MNLYNSSTYMKDLDETIQQTEWLSMFEGKSILITGSTGLICSGVADLLLRYSEQHNGCIKVFAAGRNQSKVNARYSKYYKTSYFKYVAYDSTQKNNFNFHADYIIHGACNASPAKIQSQPIETMTANFSGMKELLEFAKTTHTRNTVFISSSEVYGQKETLEPFQEDDYGFIDILNPRSSYSMGKRATETLCASYSLETGVAVSIVRPGHIYGPTATRTDNRVASAFAYDVLDGKDLVLKSSGSQIRSYCYVLDCATAILMVTLLGKTATAYNISNPNSIITIREIAELFAKHGNVQIHFEFPCEFEKSAFNPMQNSSLNSQRLQDLGWNALYDSNKGTKHTIKIFKECQ